MIALLLFLLVSCGTEEPTHLMGTAMTMDWRVTVGKDLSTDELDKIEQVIRLTFQEIDDRYNRYNPNSELSKLNNAEKEFICSDELITLLLLTEKMVKKTGGKFDPTVFPTQQAWTLYYSNPTTAPEPLPYVGWDNLTIEGKKVKKKHPKTALDLGGIAKGYGIDLLVERISKLGYPNLLIEWGGEIACAGKHPSGREWRVAIPGSNETTTLIDEAIASSGNYFQYWEANGSIYSHIIDPKTQKPIKKTDLIQGVTVKAKSCAEADAIATAGMLIEKDKIEKFKQEHPESSVWMALSQYQE